ncbi:quinon protein alcohol dehydrogenase-like superfamily, partial [Mycena albidolilacea]
MAGHTAWVLSVAFSPDGSQLVSAAEDGSIRVWDVQTGLTLVQFIGHSCAVKSVVYTIDGKRVVSGSDDATIRIWNIEGGQEEVSLDGRCEILSLSISSGGTTLVSGSVRGVVQLWDIAQHKCTREVLRLGYGVSLSTVFSPDASRIAIGRWDGQVSVWNTSTGVVETTLYQQHPVSSVAFSRDSSLVASGGRNGMILISQASSGSLLGELNKHTVEVKSLVFSADGRRLFSASADATSIRVWSLFDGSLPTLAPPSTHEPLSSSREERQAFHPKSVLRLFDGFLPTSASSSTHEPFSSSRGEYQAFHSKPVLSVAFSPDERWLVSTYGDLGVLVWDTESGKCAARLRGFALHLTPLSFHPKSTSSTFACGFNKHVCLWDPQTWKETTKLRGHTGRVNCVQFTYDGRTLISSSEDGTVKLWDNTSKTNTRTLS